MQPSPDSALEPSGAAPRPIPFLDLRAQYATIRGEIEAAVLRVVESQQFVLGPDVRELEEELEAYTGSRHAIGCGSGSDALLLALLALEIGPGDAVLTTPFSFFATAGSIARAGARPVFADIDPRTFNLDPAAVAEALQRHAGIKAIIPVHLFGACADMDPILEQARRGGVAVIEDAAQAIGASYKGSQAGTLGDIGCFSFFPSKNLGGFGEGGLLTTGSDVLAGRLRKLRVHGSAVKYYHEMVGINSRLDTLQAAVLRVKLRHLDGWTAARQRNAELYTRLLTGLGAAVAPPFSAPHTTRHIYNQYVIRSARRDALREALQREGIPTELYYPLPLHLQQCFAALGYRAGDFPESERAAREVLALPVYPELGEAAIDRIARAIAAAV
jgi:dTDP-4-amino-4,6-dideoxygalactose transaminase